MQSLTKKQKRDLTRIIIAMIMFFTLLILQHTHVIPEEYHKSIPMLLVYLVPYFIVGYDVVRKCILGVAHGQMFDESFLMTLATVGAFGSGEFDEAVAVMLFYQVGEFFQGYAVGKSRGAIQDLMSIAPDYANKELEDGSIEVIDPDDIEIGDILVIKPGEKIPIDGIITEGEGLINTSALTGESMPRFAQKGDSVISGCINGANLIKVQADREYDDSTVAKILELVENAASKKSRAENFITRFAKYYTPIVVIGAVLLAFIPPIFVGNFKEWMLRACTFLVISCPCALVISVPLAFFGGIGAASREGVLVKGSNYLEMMANLDTIVFDKTGTLTEGKFRVSMVEAAPGKKTEDVLRFAAAAESGSTHPIAESIAEACEKPFAASKVSGIENVSGKGMKAFVGRKNVVVGSAKLFAEEGIEIPSENAEIAGTVVYVAVDGNYIGTIVVSDEPKAGAADAVKAILNEGVRKAVMLTGDAADNAERIAGELGITDYLAGLLPQDKVSAVEKLIGEIRDGDKLTKTLAFAGDGINDAPVLSRVDIGIAMGSMGSDAAIEAADIVIMDDSLARIPVVIRIARKTVGISKANIIFALAVKIACLILGALGIANMWAAVFADVGVAVICILNSMRVLAANYK